MITLVHPHFSYPGHVKAKSSIKIPINALFLDAKKKRANENSCGVRT